MFKALHAYSWGDAYSNSGWSFADLKVKSVARLE